MPRNGWTYEPNGMSNYESKNGRMGGVNQGLYEQSSVQNFPIGYKRVFDDGREYRYGYFAAAVNRGVLVGPDRSSNCVVEIDNKATAAAIGATSVILTDAGTLSAVTADQFAGGYLHTTDDTGEGYQYRIKSNTAASSNAVTFTLYDPLVIAIDTTTDVAITGCQFDELIIASTTDTLVTGVSVINMTANYYGWVQVAGIATVLSDGVIPDGAPVTLSDGVNGAVQQLGGGPAAVGDLITEQFVGTACFASDDTGHVGVKLCLE